MDETQKQIHSELTVWQKQMLQRPSIFNRLSKSVQGSGPACRQTGSEFRVLNYKICGVDYNLVKRSPLILSESFDNANPK